MKQRPILSVLAACGAVASLASMANAEPTIYLSGATLLENLLNRRAATVDFIGVQPYVGINNARGRAYPGPSNTYPYNVQLAPLTLPFSGSGSTYTPAVGQIWNVGYAAVGSGNGLQNLVNTGRGFATLAGNAPNAELPLSQITTGYFNRYRIINAGAGVAGGGSGESGSFGNITNNLNPGGLPVRQVSDVTNRFETLFTGIGAASTQPNSGLTANGGLSVDIAPIDVPVSYFVTIAGTGNPQNNPGQIGYGNNLRVAKNKDGSDTTTNSAGTSGGGNRLVALAPTIGTDPAANINESAPDANTIFNTPIAFAPVGVYTNFGTGLSQIDLSDLQHLYVAGRRENGENLHALSRDSGSGTRVGFMNSMGIDASYGVGENVGTRNNGGPTAGVQEVDRPGALFVPSNKDGSGNMERAVSSDRLAIANIGAERAQNTGTVLNGRIELLAVRNNVAPFNTLPGYNPAVYSRPTINAITDNDSPNAYILGGPGGFATFGNPAHNDAVAGGLGWEEPYYDTNGNGQWDAGEPLNDFNNIGVQNPVEPRVAPAGGFWPMRNVAAAQFVNNFTRSIQGFIQSPGGSDTLFTPGEFLVLNFVPVATQKNSQNPLDPTNLQTNGAYNPTFYSYIRNSANSNVYTRALYASFGTQIAPTNVANSPAGKVPMRTQGTGYSDSVHYTRLGVTNTGLAYLTQGGTQLVYTAAFGSGTAAYSSGTNIPMRNWISGDFNADGMRNLNDATELVAAYVDRTGGAQWNGGPMAPVAASPLATIIASVGASFPYNRNDACIELLGDFNNDGSFDREDVRYWADGLAIDPNTSRLNRQLGFTAIDTAFGGNLLGTTLSTTTGLPSGFVANKTYQPGDSRGDIAGSTAGRVTRGWAPTGFDGVIDANDIAYVRAQFTNNPGVIGSSADWSDVNEAGNFDLSADMNGDLVVNQADVDMLVRNILGTCFGDLNADGRVTTAERATVIANVGTLPATLARGDINGDGVINASDVTLACPADFNCDGTVNVNDIFAFLSAWFARSYSSDVGATNVAGNVNNIFAFLSVWFARC